MYLRNLNRSILSIARFNRQASCLFSTCRVLTAKEPLTDEPIKFSTSKAKEWDAFETFIAAKRRQMPTSQKYYIVGSFCVMLIYFVFIREPNDIDEIFDLSLEQSLKVDPRFINQQIKEYEDLGLDVSKMKKAIDVKK